MLFDASTNMAGIRNGIGYAFVLTLTLVLGNLADGHELSELLRGYDKTERPESPVGNATYVELSIHVNAIFSINEITMDYMMDLLLRQYWYDDRLRFNGTTFKALGNYGIKDIWWPDTYFYNAKNGDKHDVTFPNDLAHIHPNGQVQTSLRLSMKLSCTMNLHYFPLDEQYCTIKVGSFGYTRKDLVYFLPTPGLTFENISLPEFIIDTDSFEQIEGSHIFKTGNFSYVRFKFHMVRDFGFYLIQTYIPSMLIVILSWLSFWLDVHATPARVSLGLLTVLTMTTQNSGINSHLPRVSYIKAIDIWMSTCLVFVFGALLEYAWANVLARSEEEMNKRKMNEVTVVFENPHLVQENDDKITNGDIKTDSNRSRTGTSLFNHQHLTGNRIDKISRIVFPLSYILFNVIYWCHYLCRWFQNDKCIL